MMSWRSWPEEARRLRDIPGPFASGVVAQLRALLGDVPYKGAVKPARSLSRAALKTIEAANDARDKCVRVELKAEMRRLVQCKSKVFELGRILEADPIGLREYRLTYRAVLTGKVVTRIVHDLGPSRNGEEVMTCVERER
jgi:hypothetical protein